MERFALRSRLLNGLDAGAVLITAGAGFGKTTALEQALSERPGEAVWIKCTPVERDPGQLLARLVEELARSVPGVGEPAQEMLASGLAPLDPVEAWRTVLGELGRLLVDPLVLVFDDAESLAGSGAPERMVGQALEPRGEWLSVAIASRRTLAMRVAKLRATGRLTEIGVVDLVFSADECTEMLRRYGSGDPTPAEIESLLTSTEGWPLGVALTVRGGGSETIGSRAAVFEYLAEEVWAPITRPRRDAILAASLPVNLSMDLIDAIGLPAKLLDQLAVAGLVIGAEDDLHFHPLFREFLRDRLRSERTADERAELHALLAPVLASAGRRVEAIEQWLEASRWQEALTELELEGLSLDPPFLLADRADLAESRREAPIIRR